MFGASGGAEGMGGAELESDGEGQWTLAEREGMDW